MERIAVSMKDFKTYQYPGQIKEWLNSLMQVRISHEVNGQLQYSTIKHIHQMMNVPEDKTVIALVDVE